MIFELDGEFTKALSEIPEGHPRRRLLNLLDEAVFHGHVGAVACVAYSPDGLRIVSGSDDLTARVWDAQTVAELSILLGHKEDVTCVAYSPDGRRVASAGRAFDKTVRVAMRTAVPNWPSYADMRRTSNAFRTAPIVGESPAPRLTRQPEYGTRKAGLSC